MNDFESIKEEIAALENRPQISQEELWKAFKDLTRLANQYYGDCQEAVEKTKQFSYELEETIGDLSRESRGLGMDLERLRKKESTLTETKAACEELEKELNRLKEMALSELPQKKERLETERKKILETIASDEKTLELLQQSIDNCERTKEAIKDRFALKKREKEASNADIHSMQDSIATIEQLMEVNKQKAGTLRDRLQLRKDELAEIENEYSYYQNELDELNCKNTEIIKKEKNLPFKKQELADQRKYLEERESHLQAEEELCSQQEQQLNVQKEVLDARRQKVEAQKQRCILLKAEVEDLQSLCSGDYEENEKRLLEQKAAFEKLASDTDQQLTSLNSEIEKMRQDIAVKEERIQKMDAEQRDLEKNISEKRDALEERQTRLRVIREDSEKLNKEYQSSEALLKEESQRLEAIGQRKGELEKQRDELARRIQKEAMAFNQEVNPKVNDEITGLKKRMDILEEACQALRTDFHLEEHHQSSADTIQSSLGALRQQLDNIRSTYKTMLSALETNN